jgi:hypothetical protein
MKRPIRKADRNQPELVEQIRKIPGTSVAHTHVLGKGFPDLVVSHKGFNYLLEIKDPLLPPSQRKLSDDEKDFHSKWTGQIAVIETIDDFLTLIANHNH